MRPRIVSTLGVNTPAKVPKRPLAALVAPGMDGMFAAMMNGPFIQLQYVGTGRPDI
jgi:hypothetical protein